MIRVRGRVSRERGHGGAVGAGPRHATSTAVDWRAGSINTRTCRLEGVRWTPQPTYLPAGAAIAATPLASVDESAAEQPEGTSSRPRSQTPGASSATSF